MNMLRGPKGGVLWFFCMTLWMTSVHAYPWNWDVETAGDLSWALLKNKEQRWVQFCAPPNVPWIVSLEIPDLVSMQVRARTCNGWGEEDTPVLEWSSLPTTPYNVLNQYKLPHLGSFQMACIDPTHPVDTFSFFNFSSYSNTDSPLSGAGSLGFGTWTVARLDPGGAPRIAYRGLFQPSDPSIQARVVLQFK